MTVLSVAIRNYLAQDEDLKRLLGRSESWDTWIFSDHPQQVTIENNGRCLVVVTEDDQWASPNQHNTMDFPQVFVDIWADSTRNSDRSVQVFDAKDKILKIKPLIDRHLHLVNLSNPEGLPYMWGTADEILNKTGVIVAGSQRISGPKLSPVLDSPGAWMGRITYGINLP